MHPKAAIAAFFSFRHRPPEAQREVPVVPSPGTDESRVPGHTRRMTTLPEHEADLVQLQQQEGVAILTLNRPAQRNAPRAFAQGRPPV